MLYSLFLSLTLSLSLPFFSISQPQPQEWEDIVLSPLSDKTGPISVLYFAQGADLQTSQYVEILTLLQQAVSFPLWIGIPQCPNNVAAIPGCLELGYTRVTTTMKKQGLREIDFTFYAGHSLGGAMTPDYVFKHSSTTNGMILLGAFLQRIYKTAKTPEGRPQFEFPVPTLTIGGELDGLCRLTRIAESLYSQVTFAANPDLAASFLPVTVIPGMNHMEFASGIPPEFVKANDLQAEITEDEAHELVVADMSAFLNSIVYPTDPSHLESLKARVKESQDFTQPITDALIMESYEQFLPPCYCETPDEYGGLQYGTCVSTPYCTGGVKWTTEMSQVLMSGANTMDKVKGLTITGADSLHFVTEEDPSCHLPHVHGNPVDNANPGSSGIPPLCSSPDGCVLNITTVTQHLYHNSGEVDIWRLHFSVPWLDTGYLPIAASELLTKLKSRQAIWQAAGLIDTQFNETDPSILEGGEHDLCGEINQHAINWAFSKLPATTQSRFEKYGQQLVIGNDLGTCIAGPCWIWDRLKFERDNEANTVNIQSVWFGSENVNNYPCGEEKKIPCSSGFHYCKILSPARALEWMYVDGLRNKLSTRNL